LLTSFRTKCNSRVTQLKVEDRKITDSETICEVLANTFVLKDTESKDFDSLEAEIFEYTNNYNYDESPSVDQFPVTVTQSEVSAALKSVKVKKSFNPTNIAPAVVMKETGQVFINILVCLFSNIINTNAIPTAFKKANVRPLYKGKGSRLCSTNYRPISLLTDYCKVFEKFLSNRIMMRVDSQLNENQHAYRVNRSCHTALTKFTNDIFKGIDKTKTKTNTK